MITEIKHPNNTEAFKTHTVYGRFNKIVEPLTEIDISKYENAFNPSRYQAVTVRDALINPHQTIKSPPPIKDAGYHELKKRSQYQHDQINKVV